MNKTMAIKLISEEYDRASFLAGASNQLQINILNLKSQIKNIEVIIE